MSRLGWVGIAAILLSGRSAFGEKVLMTGLECEKAAFCQDGGCEILESTVTKFGNKNIFSRYSGSLALYSGHEVVLKTMKDVWTSSEMMEALQKIYTLKSIGVSRVLWQGPDDIRVKRDSGDASFINLKPLRLMTVLGLANTKAGTTPSWNKIAPLARAKTLHIASTNHSALAQEVATILKQPYVADYKNLAMSSGDAVLLMGAPVFELKEGDAAFHDTLMEWLDALVFLGEKNPQTHAFSSYYPYARSDKANDQKADRHVGVYAAMMAELIQNLPVHSMAFVRAHAAQTQGFFGRLPAFDLSARSTLVESINQFNPDVYVAPDAGAQKEVTLFAQMANRPVIVANKMRDPETGKPRLISLTCAEVKGKRVVIVDDETGSGSTLNDTANDLKSECQVESIAVAVTHLCGNAEKLLENENVDQIFATNTIPLRLKSDKLTYVSMASRIAEHYKNLVLAK